MATSPDRGAAGTDAPARRTTPWTRLTAFLRIDAPGNHRGALSPAVAILAVMIFTLAGLVIDGGRQLGAKSRAVGYAQEAARVGAATIQLNTSEAKIDTAKAGTAVAAFCAQVSQNDKAVQQCGTTELTDEGLKVQVVIGNKTTFLGMVGIGHLDATGTGEAHAEQGVKKADDSPKIPPIVVSTPGDGPGNVTITDTAVPPTLDLPCPTWTIGSPTPTWTLSFPFPPTCTPSVTPTPESPTPTSPSPSPTPSGGGGAPLGVPENSQPPGANR
ncbi:TadE/TadG family type IV pilus assembly protein [Kribbella catacumbae]|uniref:TadE/TadG family type IV pilus assembly protein n=1 Tax=Kribbella catacumbae TaxID=460086 RepID=UPI0003633732|nr:TadE/TadG family type IV pilus assembly protein [Kribbella catacumbae]